MNKFFASLFILLSMSFATKAQKIMLDGLMSDWAKITEKVTDSSDDCNMIDFKEMAVSNDADWLYIKLRVANPMLLAENNNIFLEIDVDNNATTGYRINGIGAEFGWNFGGRFGYYNKNKNASIIAHNDLNMSFLPSHEAMEFEIMLRRNAKPDGISELFVKDTIKILFWDKTTKGDLLPDKGKVFQYVFSNDSNDTFSRLDIGHDTKKSIRVMTWNVFVDGLTDTLRQSYFKRVLQAISPEIITFNEFWKSDTSQVLKILNEFLPLKHKKGWTAIKNTEGNITCSAFPVKNAWIIAEGHRMSAVLVSVHKYGFNEMLVINYHLRCCEADDERLREAFALDAFLADAQTPGGVIDLSPNTPFYLSGDMNLVGSYKPMDVLLGEGVNSARGNDWDGSALLQLVPSHTEHATATTWRDIRKPFSPSRLDYFLYSGYTLIPVKSFILATEEMPAETLTKYGLTSEDTKLASDHLPVVVDFVPKFIDASFK